MNKIIPFEEGEDMTNQQREHLKRNLGVSYVNGKIIIKKEVQ